MRKLILLCTMGIALGNAPVHAQSSLDSIMERRGRHAWDDLNIARARKSLQSLQADGSWKDLDYADRKKGGWSAFEHIERLKSMCVAWGTPSSPLYHNAELWQACSRSLEHWIQHRYTSTNWWYNEIGVPRLILEIIALCRHQMNAAQREGALQLLGQHRVNGTGANLVWSADLALHYGALTGDTSMIRSNRDLILQSITIGQPEGIQYDFSFFQHKQRLQSLHYGASFLQDNLLIAWELHGTPWAFPKEQIDLLTNYVQQGLQWMLRNSYTSPATLDRAVSRPHALRRQTMPMLVDRLQELNPDKASDINDMWQAYRTNTRKPAYHAFPIADFSAYHRPGFSFFLKTISDRTLTTESINGENKKGHLLNAGNTWFMADGKEYFDLMPLWDWQYLPGLTSFHPQAKPQQQSYAGIVHDNDCGLSAMHYAIGKDSSRISARKIWATWNNIVIALVAGIEYENVNSPVFTVLEQSWWRNPVLTAKGQTLQRAGHYTIPANGWVYQAPFAYKAISGGTLQVQLKDTTGNWKAINEGESAKSVHGKVFQVMMEHRSRESIAYAVTYASTATQLKQQPAYNILRNDKNCQAVYFPDGTCMAAFHTATDIRWKDMTIHIDRPCLLLYRNNTLYVSDPLHKGGNIHIQFNNHSVNIPLQQDGSTSEHSI